MLNSQKKHFIIKNFLPFSFSIILISILAIKSLYSLEHEHLRQQSEDIRSALIQTYASNSNLNQKKFAGLIDMFAHDKEIISYFKKGDRESLYQHSKKIFKNLIRSFNISHFYFHLPNKEVFLRVHNSIKYSDFIARYTLEQASISQKVFAGLELGLFNSLTFRVVKPWVINGELLGYIELGEDINHMASSLLELLPVSQVAITIDKNLGSNPKYQKWYEFLKEKKQFDDSNSMIIADSTFYTMHASIKELLTQNKSIINQSISVDALKYLANSVSLRNAKGEVIGSIVLFTNIKDAELKFKKLLFKSIFIIAFISLLVLIFYYFYIVKIIGISIKDDMTGLYNRGYFNTHSQQQLQQVLKSKKLLALFVVDIDNFKLYNDTYGHIKGDEALKKVSQIMMNFFNRKDQIVYRVGGEEFAIIFPIKDKEQSKKVAQKLVDKVFSEKMVHDKNETFGFVSISVGAITTAVDETTTIDSLYAQADIGLYKAKEQGRNRVVFVDS